MLQNSEDNAPKRSTKKTGSQQLDADDESEKTDERLRSQNSTHLDEIEETGREKTPLKLPLRESSRVRMPPKNILPEYQQPKETRGRRTSSCNSESQGMN